MTMNHLTGAQARSLVEGATAGPWWVTRETQSSGSTTELSVRKVCPPGTTRGLATVDDLDPNTGTPDADLALMAAAPSLAETVAWLCGRKPDTGHPDEGDFWVARNYTVQGNERGVQIHSESGIGTITSLTRDESIDLARALLAAAEMSRPIQ